MSEFFYRKLVPIGITTFVLGKAADGGYEALLFVSEYSPNVPPESAGGILDKLQSLLQGKVTTKHGTYRIRAPTPDYVTKKEQQDLCQYYVERYEKYHNTWGAKLLEGPFIKRLCGISLDDILNNIRGGTNN